MRIPFGPSESVSAILLVNGGEMSGSIDTADKAMLNHVGSDRRVTA